MVQAIICGGRDEFIDPRGIAILNALHAKYHFTEVVHGGARGVDRDAHAWAKSKGIPVKMMLPTYDKYPNQMAPIRRNTEMAAYVSDDAICIAFPGNNGTADMVRKAKKRGLTVIFANEMGL